MRYGDFFPKCSLNSRPKKRTCQTNALKSLVVQTVENAVENVKEELPVQHSAKRKRTR